LPAFRRRSDLPGFKGDMTMAYQSVNPNSGKVLESFEELDNTQLESALATADL
jgi:hypothetical protein